MHRGTPEQTRSAARHSRERSTDTPGSQQTAQNTARQRIIFASNRGPIEYQLGEDGQPVAGRGAGGVVSGLLSAARGRAVTWIALAMTDADRQAAASADEGTLHAPAGLKQLDLRLVDVAPATYRRYYDRISNGVLWFAQHYLLRPGAPGLFGPRTAEDWQKGYRVVNQAVADAVIAELEAHGPQTPVFFQDYHLYLAPTFVRERVPSARLAQFVHIPWPDSRYWEMLPEFMVRAIYRGLAANDCVFFQTQRDANNFVAGALRALRGVKRVFDARTNALVLSWNQRTIRVAAHPIALDPAPVRASARSAAATAQAQSIADDLHLDEHHQLILRVDRVEPTKNIVRGFLAYERLLKLHPELKGGVTFLALLVPSRESLAAYRAYAGQVERTIARINEQLGTPDWQPIVALVDNDQARALACMRRYDVLLVNPIIDGMNLVVKEGGLVNARSGVIVLTRTAGAYEQLGGDTLNVAPTDIPGTAEALHRALTMPMRQRKANARNIRAVLGAESARQWLDAQLADLAQAVRQHAAIAARQATAASPQAPRKPRAKVTLLRSRGSRGQRPSQQRGQEEPRHLGAVQAR